MKIIGCGNCPLSFVVGEDLKCFHPDTGANSFINDVELENDKKPKWCPLIESKFILELDSV